MPKWSEYLEVARSRGALALELFVVQSEPASGPDAMKETLPRHLEYQKEMEARGVLVFAGPVSDETGEEMNGAGMIIYRAGSFDEARSFAEADPMHAEGRRSFTLKRWLINEGSLTVSLSLSGQHGRID